MTDDNIVSASRVIQAPAEQIFDVLSDASRHAEIDGSGTVQNTRNRPEPLTLGSQFGMDMKLGPIPYPIKNTVVEFEPNRLIAWKHVGLHRWRYELEPIDQHSTKVTESFDWSDYPGLIGNLIVELTGYPKRNLAAIEATLKRLAATVEDNGAANTDA